MQLQSYLQEKLHQEQGAQAQAQAQA